LGLGYVSPRKAEGRGQKAFMLVFMPIALGVLALDREQGFEAYKQIFHIWWLPIGRGLNPQPKRFPCAFILLPSAFFKSLLF
jgi:hypothetical protein